MGSDGINPYASPAAAFNVSSDPRRDALASLRGPSLGLLILGGICSLALLHGLLVAVLVWSGRPFSLLQAIYSLSALPSCFILYGAWCMRRGRCYRLALAAAVLASIPLLSPGIWIGIPFGIWALVVLRRPDVRAAFS